MPRFRLNVTVKKYINIEVDAPSKEEILRETCILADAKGWEGFDINTIEEMPNVE